MKVYLAQLLCPQRHAILGYAIEMDEDFTEELKNRLKNRLSLLKDGALAQGLMDPWCGICGATAETWFVDVGRTRWETLAEATPFLREAEARQAATRRHVQAMKQKATQN